MPTFQQQIETIKDINQHKHFRLQKIADVEQITNRPLIVYAAKQMGGFNVPNSIDNSDITGFSDLIEGISVNQIDILLDSPGGQAEATERIVNLLRENFDHIRFLIPHSAYSAATMLALSGNEILMDDRSTLGPIDPQIIISSPTGGVTSVPAQDILDAFADVRKVLKKEGPGVLSAYFPMLARYDLHIFEICKKGQKLSRTIVNKWLKNYMLKDDPRRESKAKKITKRLSDHRKNLSHGRSIGIKEGKRIGLKIRDLREMPDLRKTLWELYCSIELYFDRSPAVKLFENSKGVSWARNFQEQLIRIPNPSPPPPPPKQPSRD